MRKTIFLMLAWVLTINGAEILLDWIGVALNAMGVSTTTMPSLPFVGTGLQILLYVLAILFGALAFRQKEYRALALIPVCISGLMILNIVGKLISAMAQGLI